MNKYLLSFSNGTKNTTRYVFAKDELVAKRKGKTLAKLLALPLLSVELK